MARCRRNFQSPCWKGVTCSTHHPLCLNRAIGNALRLVRAVLCCAIFVPHRACAMRMRSTCCSAWHWLRSARMSVAWRHRPWRVTARMCLPCASCVPASARAARRSARTTMPSTVRTARRVAATAPNFAANSFPETSATCCPGKAPEWLRGAGSCWIVLGRAAWGLSRRACPLLM